MIPQHISFRSALSFFLTKVEPDRAEPLFCPYYQCNHGPDWFTGGDPSRTSRNPSKDVWARFLTYRDLFYGGSITSIGRNQKAGVEVYAPAQFARQIGQYQLVPIPGHILNRAYRPSTRDIILEPEDVDRIIQDYRNRLRSCPGLSAIPSTPGTSPEFQTWWNQFIESHFSAVYADTNATLEKAQGMFPSAEPNSEVRPSGQTNSKRKLGSSHRYPILQTFSLHCVVSYPYSTLLAGKKATTASPSAPASSATSRPRHTRSHSRMKTSNPGETIDLADSETNQPADKDDQAALGHGKKRRKTVGHRPPRSEARSEETISDENQPEKEDPPTSEQMMPPPVAPSVDAAMTSPPSARKSLASAFEENPATPPGRRTISFRRWLRPYGKLANPFRLPVPISTSSFSARARARSGPGGLLGRNSHVFQSASPERHYVPSLRAARSQNSGANRLQHPHESATQALKRARGHSLQGGPSQARLCRDPQPF